MSDTQLQLAVAQDVAISQDANPLQIIARAAADPKVDVGKMQALIEMQKDIMRTQAEIEFNQAMVRLQPKLPQIYKSQAGNHGKKYSPFESIDQVVRPLYTAEGFAVTFTTAPENGVLFVTATVRHAGGHKEPTTVPMPIEKNAANSGSQNMGSTISYGKRYALCAAFNIVTTGEDNDGGGIITLDQQIVINDLLKETKADKAKFLTFMGCSAVDAIPASQYAKAVNALERKRR